MMIGFCAPAEQPGDRLDLVGVGDRAADHPIPLGEELGREVERVRLDVLGQRQHHGTGVHRVGQHAHRGGQRGEQLLGPVDAVEEPGDRPERVVDRGVGLDRVLQLLQHRALPPRGVGVARQQQHRQPVHRGQPGRGDQVECTRTDRGSDREGGVATAGLGVADGQVGQRLLVAALHERHHVAELVQRLAHAGDVAVAEDAESGGDEPAALAVGDGVLPGQVGDHGLGDGQPDRLARTAVAHGCSLCSCLVRGRVVTRAGRAGRPSSHRSSRRPRCAGLPCRCRCPSGRRRA